jgi:hypothetical protein
VREGVSEWMREWMSEWMSECVSEGVKVVCHWFQWRVEWYIG